MIQFKGGITQGDRAKSLYGAGRANGKPPGSLPGYTQFDSELRYMDSNLNSIQFLDSLPLMSIRHPQRVSLWKRIYRFLFHRPRFSSDAIEKVARTKFDFEDENQF